MSHTSMDAQTCNCEECVAWRAKNPEIAPGTLVFVPQFQAFATIGEDSIYAKGQMHYRLNEHGAFATRDEFTIIEDDK